MSKALAFINDKRVRDVFYQGALLIGLAALLVYFIRNASQNMVQAGIASGFDFLWRTSGIEVPFVLTNYTQSDNILSLFWAGVANTMLVTVIALVLSTALGFLIGIARLSSIWLVQAIAGAYVEFVRNIPLLFFVLFWYFGVIAALPAPRESLSVFGVAFLVHYISQFMSLQPGDIISTGTPPGVGLGIKPDPVFLHAGQTIRLGIEGLGEQQQLTVDAA